MKLSIMTLVLGAGLLCCVFSSTTEAQVIRPVPENDFAWDELATELTESASYGYETGYGACDGCCDSGCCNSGGCCPGCCGSYLHACCPREYMFGDWFGSRPCLAQRGIVVDLELTQFYQGVVSGGANETDKYGGKLDYMITFLGEPLGLNKGFVAILHAETRFGEDVILDAAGLAPVNANMTYPSLDNTTSITGLQFIQAVSEEWAFTFGKINTLDFFNTLYPQTGRGVDGFMNISSFLPMTVARTVPLSFLAAGVLKMDQGRIQGAFMVYDNHNSTTTSGFENLFDNGANVIGLWRFFTNYGCLPGSHLFLGTWANGNYTSFDTDGWGFIPGVGLTIPEETGTWSATYILEQKLWVDPCCQNRSLGLMSQWGIADPKTSPYGWVGNVSLQGHGLNARRPDDSMGVAYFYTGLSNDFKTLVDPVIPVDDLQGVELYYNAAVTPWFHLTFDLQIVDPAITANDTAVVLGLRGKIDL